MKKTNTVYTEWRAHQDELSALWQAERFGQDVFYGIKNARVVFVDYELGEPKPHSLYIGIGNADKYSEYAEFNEHRSDGRLQGTCASMMMAQRLRTRDKPRMRQFLEEVLKSDTEPNIFPTQLASLIKAMHRVKKGKDQMGTYLWATAAFDAIAFRDADNSVDIRKLWQEFCQGHVVCPEMNRVAQLVSGSFGRRKSLVTELGSIVSRMDSEVGYRWLAETFSMMVEDAHIFSDAVRQMNGGKADSFDVQVEGGIQNAYFIRTDNEHAGRAASSELAGTAAMCVVRNTNGHTQIHANPRLGLPMGEFVALLRMAEFKKWKGKNLSFEKAHGEGTIPECKQWHLPNPHTILNGSLTHPWIAASKLTIPELAEVAYHAFTDTGRKIWLDRYMGRQLVEVTEAIDLGAAMDAALEKTG